MSNITDNQTSLLMLLASPVQAPQPKRYSGSRDWKLRSVYEGADERTWGITYSGDIAWGPMGPKTFSAEDVLPLFEAGYLASDYPDEPRVAKAAFHLSPTGFSAVALLMQPAENAS